MMSQARILYDLWLKQEHPNQCLEDLSSSKYHAHLLSIDDP